MTLYRGIPNFNEFVVPLNYHQCEKFFFPLSLDSKQQLFTKERISSYKKKFHTPLIYIHTCVNSSLVINPSLSTSNSLKAISAVVCFSSLFVTLRTTSVWNNNMFTTVLGFIVLQLSERSVWELKTLSVYFCVWDRHFFTTP